MTKFVMIMDGRTIVAGGTISDVHVISIVWLVMIGEFQSRGNFLFVPAPQRQRQRAGETPALRNERAQPATAGAPTRRSGKLSPGTVRRHAKPENRN